ncbi:cyanate permease [Orbus hercynius]|uniref:Cyanate permease n=1 Tax=Orbus hercynius TaxID=593135 RepID=A0A495RK00_9GAMM|nr:MFS transporter [Orbus hercynius]RKS87486.1 cyanate permease [Orbus hercynius]
MKQLNNNIASYVLYTFVLMMTMGLPMFMFYSIGVLSPTLIREFAIDKSLIGVLTIGTFTLAALLSLWAGNIVAYLGAKKTLTMVFGCVLVSFSLLIVFRSFFGMMLALLFSGVAQSLTNPLTNLMIAQRVDTRFKSMIIGIKQSGIQCYALLAGLLIPYMMTKYDWQFIFILQLPVIAILMVIAPRVALPNDHPSSLKLKLIKPHKLLTLLILTQFCVGMVVSSYVTYIGLFAIEQHLPEHTIGLLISLFGLMGMISRITITTLGEKINNETLLLPILISMAIVVLIILMFTTHNRHWPLWFSAFGIGSSIVVCNAIAMSILLKDQRFGQAINSSALLSSGFFAGFAIGPPVFGWIQTAHWGFYGAWFALIIMLVIALLMSLVLYHTNSESTGQ